MRGLFLAALCLALSCCCAAVPAFAGEESASPPAFDFRVVERIELACRIGVGKARSEADALASLRWRNGALTAIAEVAYQATLAWFADRPDLVAVLESEQGGWLNDLRAMPSGSREELDRIAEFLHRRLEVFMTITTVEPLRP